MRRITLLFFFFLLLTGCHSVSLEVASELQQSKRYFEAGYYKRAMRLLLPLACAGNAQAEYAVGYLYYYGYGTTQNLDTGYFWIERAASHHFPPAIIALQLILHEEDSAFARSQLNH